MVLGTSLISRVSLSHAELNTWHGKYWRRSSKKNNKKQTMMSKFVEQFDMYTRAHEAFRAGNKTEGLKHVLFLLGAGLVKPHARDLYEFWKSSVMGQNGSEELFGMMVDIGVIPEVLKQAKAGKIILIENFIAEIAKLDEDTKYHILKAV